tara:strand:- start:1015 stop:1971 length:957 start_codon:yes stop_codon:yes gene_type:complete
MTSPHVPVMLNEMRDALFPRDGANYLDATFGAGGYSRALLEAANCNVWAIDCDPVAVDMGKDLARYYGSRFMVLEGHFGNMKALLADVGISAVDGITFDLGVSSMQIDDPVRGFSFRADGPLDMRMSGAKGDVPSAADVVNYMAERELADIIYRFGNERASRRISRAIVKFRKRESITRTAQLAGLVRSIVRKPKSGLDPATRTFQALRIYVNQELTELEKGLRGAEGLLLPGGRLVIVSFHSLEDRRIKKFLQQSSGVKPRPSRHMPDQSVTQPPTFRLINRDVLRPTPSEISLNPRARSAKLRWAERTCNPIQNAA